MEHFGTIGRGEAEPLVNVRDGLENLRITQAIVQTAKSEKMVQPGTF